MDYGLLTLQMIKLKIEDEKMGKQRIKKLMCILLSFLMIFSNINITEGDAEIQTPENNAETVIKGKFKITGSIAFNEKLDGQDWSSLVRQNEFDQPIKITQSYTDSKGEQKTKEYDTQEDISKEDFFLKFSHDGEGGGDFTIENVPKSVVDEYGVECQVTEYSVNVEPELSYYQSGDPIKVALTDPANQTTATGTLHLNLKSQTLTLKPEVVPKDSTENPTFEMNVEFTNPQISDSQNSKLSLTYRPTKNKKTEIKVPIGISYKVAQKSTTGYRFDGDYTITKTTKTQEGQDPEVKTETTKTSARGITKDQEDIEISTTNYAQNVSVGFDVKWLDNNKATRPTLTSDNFTLQYKTVNGEWKELTADQYEELHITRAPAFDTSKTSANQYAYTGLPAVDSKNQVLSYRVVVKTTPEGYIADYTDDESGRRTFIMEEQTDFSAKIIWNDTHDQSYRSKDSGNLKLYRRVENGKYELVENKLTEKEITKKDFSWDISIANLPRYNADNQEYDYVLVQGTIDENNQVTQTLIDHYKTYYDNGSGNHGNDTQLCHDKGTITQVLYEDVDFQAKKVWKDSGDEERPTAAVTLWRYVKDTANDIDDAYNNGKAAQVVYQIENIEKILSYDLDKTKNESEIHFNATTVSGLTQNYTFPRYDDKGRAYVYFVRETLSGEAENDYEIQYKDADGTTHENGTKSGGTITNVHRKKSAIAITKLWQNPAGLANLDGVSVKVAIKASADRGRTYDDLTVYSDKTDSYEKLTGNDKKTAQTITGFTSNIAQGEVVYYVNTYNSEGQPYDMEHAKIEETVIKNGQEYKTTTDENGNSTLTIGGNTYKVESSFVSESVLADGIPQYRYKQTNTITADREYKLIKEWRDSISENEYEDIKSVNFRLERRTTKDNPDGTQAAYEVVKTENDSDVWTLPAPEDNTKRTWETVLKGLPQYDEQGYEYYYRATEVSFTKKDGTIFTTKEANTQFGWYADHSRTPEQTTAYNYRGNTNNGYFTVSKVWRDNGDSVDGTRKNVKIRVYDRQKLNEVLSSQIDQEGKKDTDIVDLSAIKNTTENTYYQEFALTADNQYTRDIYYNGLKSLGENENKNWENYIVLEYSVGDPTSDGATTAQYSYADLIKATESENAYTFSGTVENTYRKYKTDTAIDPDNQNGHVVITNTRVGTTQITVNKDWRDENNATNHRPTSVKFQLYQDGQPYTDIPETVTVTANQVLMPYIQIPDIVAKQAGQTETTTVSLDHQTGIITVNGSSTDARWSFTINGLDMFSSTALVHTYNMDEIASDNTQTQQFSYISKKGTTSVEDQNKTQSYTFAFLNTITGRVNHVAYKYWKDPSIGAGNRPDLYMTLYRYLKSDKENHQDTNIEDLDSYQVYTDYKEQNWTTPNRIIEPQTNYNWKIEIENLPKFDENGNEYEYVFKESMNNNGITVLGTYLSKAETKTVSGIDETDEDTYEVFTNTISAYMTVQGKKTWTGLSGFQTKEDELPDPLISLYRTTDATITDINSLSDTEVQQLISEGKITLVDSTHLTDNKTRYYFPDVSDKTALDEKVKKGFVGNEDGIYMLPKFDENGERYSYLIRETIEDPVASQLYTRANTNGTLSNVFRSDLNRRSITVKKSWGGRENLKTAEEKYPSVTYELYRYEANNEENTTTKIATHTINANEFTGADGTAEYTFNNLLIYSPTGVQYCYYMKEANINGNKVSYTDESAIEDESLVGKDMMTGQNSKVQITKEQINQLKSNDRIDVISLPDKWNDASADKSETNVSVGTTNTYSDQKEVTLSGEKIWNDENDSEGLRPDKINVTLSRSTNNESGQSNKVNSTAITLLERTQKDDTLKEPYIVWDKGDNPKTSSKWSYKIYNLERYAPNGMPYIYVLSEETVTGYKEAGSVSKLATGTDINMNDLTNSFSGSYYVRKNWMDGSNKYNLRPDKITVQLQRSTDNGQTWSTYKDPVTLTADNVIKNTRNNSWEYTFTNLPTINKNGNAYKYRCIETKIGDVPITVSGSGEDKKESAAAYECKYTMQNDQKTVIENTLDSTSLVVTKKWEGDQDDLYQSRPEKLTFVLQKRGVKVQNENSGGTDTDTEDSKLGDWQDVLDSQGNPYTFTIIPNANGEWTKTLEDLPTAEVYVGEDGNTYTIYSLHFRAVEVHVDDSKDAAGNIVYGTKPSGAQNYKDTTNYALDSQDHIYNADQNRNESTITNQLITDEPTARTITITKKWNRTDGEEKTATFELLYKTKDETQWHSYEKPNVKQDSSTTTKTSDSMTWTDLPKYDKEGKELQYKVIEHALDGYKTEVSTNEDATEYTFTNIELQNYSVKKIWQNADYAQKTSNGYQATFELQQRIGDDGQWTKVEGQDPITLTSKNANDTQEATWKDLPEYTLNNEQITYRAVETKINGIAVNNDTNDSYKVSYKYQDQDNKESTGSAFKDTKTIVTNRMIYGFVNLSKRAAYFASSAVNKDNDKTLEGVEFNIYAGTDTTKTPYVSGVKTDANGNLINANGKYGKEGKYLISGTYTIKEVSAGEDYSIWKNGVQFSIGNGDITGNTDDTGEHGTAWISTVGDTGLTALKLNVEYKKATKTSHDIGDTCQPEVNENAPLWNMESRGVVTFTKTGLKQEKLDTHDGADGESSAYFGVYLDKNCTEQVAGMVPSADDKAQMILTDKDRNGTSLPVKTNKNDIAYLRAYDNAANTDYPFTLLSGTYYIKELVAPAGYKLDQVVRKAVVKKIDSIDITATDLSNVYATNPAEIMAVDATNGSVSYKWENDPNVMTIYKRDQYGRKVTLKENGYLELKVEGDQNTFPSGEKTIRLYQDKDKPATKTDGTTVVSNISYDETDGTWKITGLFDIGKTYVLSEPETSVHENHIIAKSISFMMGTDGKAQITSSESDSKAKDNPLNVTGDDYQNYYKSDASNNMIVMRDVYRHLIDIALIKQDSISGQAIGKISFKLYKYKEKDVDGNPTGVQSVLDNATYLTTDDNGKIDLQNLEDRIKNQITGCALKYGLDLGNYYFEEQERGASDNYRLASKIFFTISAKESTSEDYNDHAQVTYTTSKNVAVDSQDVKTVIVKDDPVTTVAKTLNLSKIDKTNEQTKLKDARFTLTYRSVTHGQEGSETDEQNKEIQWNCVTNDQGELYLQDDQGNVTDQKPDISKKGSYTLKEIKAPDSYMTRTEDGTTNVVTLLTFKVDSENKIKDIVKYNGIGEIVSDTTVSKDANGNEDIALNVTVKNEKTKVSIAKRNDIESDTKTNDQKSLQGEKLQGATLEVYEGTDTTNEANRKVILDHSQSDWNLADGLLKEDTIYTLHESQAPIGYQKADDIYFKLSGTTTKDGDTISQLYVWSGKTKPTAITGSEWMETTNLNRNVLTMVDEVIIAPIRLQKVLGSTDTNQPLSGAEFDVKEGNTILGKARSTAKGYLVWKEITDAGYTSKRIFNEAGKRVTNADRDTVIDHAIILQQNENGYDLTETYAPDQAYNEGKTFHVAITEENYKEYKNHTIDQYLEASTNADKIVNPPYQSTITLHKYDSDQEANQAVISGTEFTLYRDSVDDKNIYKKAYSDGTVNTTGIFTTDGSGNISITIPEKGNYILMETKAATGYRLDSAKNKFSFTLADRQGDTTTGITKTVFGYNQVNALQTDETGVGNERLKGSVTLTKKDASTNEGLNGVVYTLTRTDQGHETSTEVKTGTDYTVQQTSDGWTLVESNGTNGQIHISGLNWGSYQLAEKTELSGYQKEDNVKTFTVNGKENQLTFTKNDTNTKNQLTFYKIDQLDTEVGVTATKALKGAVFEVHEGETCTDNCQKAKFYASTTSTNQVTSVTTGADGKVTIYGLPTDINSDTPKTYHLSEVKAPKGYKLQKTPVVFTIDRQGVIKVKQSDGNYQVEHQVTMQDELIKLYIQKQGELGEVLTGVKFVLKDTCSGNECDHKLANDSSSETITISDASGKVMIPAERLIGGHTYTLEETKAPDGYESTAKVTFKVQTDGTIDPESLKSSGGYQGSGNEPCASIDTDHKIITIKDEKIGMTLTKVDSANDAKKLQDVQFTLKPQPGSSFSTKYDNTDAGFVYDQNTNTYTFTTNAEGKIQFPSGLLKYDNSYLLQEKETAEGYYLNKESKDGVILNIGKDGTITIDRLDQYKNKQVNGTSSCPIKVISKTTGRSELIATNTQATSFDLTKKVEGNMGDANGTFKIKLEIFEPDGTKIGERSVDLKKDSQYDSVTGLNGQNAFGSNAIPAGATLKITEDNALNYTAKIRITSADHTATIKQQTNNKGVAEVTLNSATKVSIELVNEKDLAIDVGVDSERQAPLAALVFVIPVIWLAYRYRRKRKEGEN